MHCWIPDVECYDLDQEGWNITQPMIVKHLWPEMFVTDAYVDVCIQIL